MGNRLFKQSVIQKLLSLLLSLTSCLAVTSHARAADSQKTSSIPENDWGIAAGFRSAQIPFSTSENHVSDFIPLMFYNGDTFFIRGLTGGAKILKDRQFSLSLIGSYRYFDIPADYQNLVQGNAFDVGIRLQQDNSDNSIWQLDLMTDRDDRHHVNLSTRFVIPSGAWDLHPYFTLRYKDSNFNNHYYGLDGFSDPLNPGNKIDNKIGSGLDLTIGSEVRYHVTSNFYLIGRAQLTRLDSDTINSSTIKHGTFGELYLGIAFFNDKLKPRSTSLKARPYVRVAHGWATPSNIGDILSFNWEDDDQDNQMTSIFYGHPIADSLFNIDAFDIYLTAGYVYHHSSDPYDQTLDPGQGINNTLLAGVTGNPCDGNNPCSITYDRQPTKEYVLGIKAYFNINTPVHWRLGAAEGVSYVESVTNIEQREMDRKGYRSSRLMNYLDFTVDLELSSLLPVRELKDLFLGIGVHHRSSIFESSSAFGRIKGGSNYNSIYLQYHF